MCSFGAPPNSIAPSRPLPIGKASFSKLRAGWPYHSACAAADGTVASPATNRLDNTATKPNTLNEFTIFITTSPFLLFTDSISPTHGPTAMEASAGLTPSALATSTIVPACPRFDWTITWASPLNKLRRLPFSGSWEQLSPLPMMAPGPGAGRNHGQTPPSNLVLSWLYSFL